MVVVETSNHRRQRQQIYHRFKVSLMYIGTDRAELCKRHCLKQIFLYRALSFLFSSVQKFYFMSTSPSPCWDFFSWFEPVRVLYRLPVCMSSYIHLSVSSHIHLVVCGRHTFLGDIFHLWFKNKENNNNNLSLPLSHRSLRLDGRG